MRIRAAVGNAALLLGAVAFALALLEGALRIWLPGPVVYRYPQERYDFDPEIGFVLRPNQRAFTHDKTVRVNSRGCRDAEYPSTPPEGVRRVLALGDSQTFGVGVAEVDQHAELARVSREPARIAAAAVLVDRGELSCAAPDHVPDVAVGVYDHEHVDVVVRHVDRRLEKLLAERGARGADINGERHDARFELGAAGSRDASPARGQLTNEALAVDAGRLLAERADVELGERLDRSLNTGSAGRACATAAADRPGHVAVDQRAAPLACVLQAPPTRCADDHDIGAVVLSSGLR